MKILLDTDICIYLINDRPEHLRQRFEQYALSDIGVSAITAAELRFGAAKSKAVEKNTVTLEYFMSPIEIIPFDSEAARVYGSLRAYLENSGTPIGPLDMLIAAHAMSCNLLLVTNNIREFSRIPGLQCETWV